MLRQRTLRIGRARLTLLLLQRARLRAARAASTEARDVSNAAGCRGARGAPRTADASLSSVAATRAADSARAGAMARGAVEVWRRACRRR